MAPVATFHTSMVPSLVGAASHSPFGAMVAHDLLEGVLLGRMTAEIDEPVRAGESYVAVGWAEAADGRKLPAGAALFRNGSQPVARARLLTFPPKR